jgi:hypothetical protein
MVGFKKILIFPFKIYAITAHSRNAPLENFLSTGVPFRRSACYSFCAITISFFNSRSFPMEWTTPQHEEIDLNCEISSYANAEL